MKGKLLLKRPRFPTYLPAYKHWTVATWRERTPPKASL